MDDLISRSALLAEYDRQHEGEAGRARKLIEAAPTIEQPTWISCAERLPEFNTKVLCVGVKGGIFIAELSQYGKEKMPYWVNGGGALKVVYWMPIPQPPKGDE